MPRFFVPRQQLPIITGSDAHQIKNVLRMKPGQTLELFDGQGNIYQAQIETMKKDRITCAIISRAAASEETKIKITLAQCLPKGKKFDLIIQKATELGVSKIIPVLSERTLGKGEKLGRWHTIAKEAAEQSGRSTVPEITPLMNFSDVIKLAKDYDLVLIPWELEKERTLKNVLTDSQISRYPSPPISRYPNILITIGPEGGFSRSEVDAAVKQGFVSVSLGRRILRTETAPLALLAILNYEYE